MKRVFLFIVAMCCGSPLAAQAPEVAVHSAFAAGTDGMPFWLHANRSARIDESGASGVLRFTVQKSLFEPETHPYSDTPFFRRPLTDTSVDPDAPKTRGFRWGYGVDLSARLAPGAAPVAHSTLLLTEAYLRAQFGPPGVQLRLTAGRKTEVAGYFLDPLTSGSLAWGTNATPLPKITLENAEWVPVPGLNGFINLRAGIAHGWFEADRYAPSPWLHEKWAYAMGGGPHFGVMQIYAGLRHYAIWGGQRNPAEIQPGGNRHYPRSAKDFLRVFIGLEGDSTASQGDQDYLLGDHKGLWEFGTIIHTPAGRILLYRNLLLEDRDGLKFKTPEDGVLGLGFRRNTRALISGFLWEHITTKWQNGPIPPPLDGSRGGPGGRVNYYNHWQYKNGWTSFGRALANPLFLVSGPGRAQLFYPDGNPGDYVYNNRIMAHHLGVDGWVAETAWRAFLTISNNHGTYHDRELVQDTGATYYFDGGRRQVYALIELKHPVARFPGMEVSVALGFDAGQVAPRRVGVGIGAVWEF